MTDWLKEAREIAERAARYFKGQHWYDPHGLVQIGFDEEEVHHIAKFDPQTVLAMLEVIRTNACYWQAVNGDGYPFDEGLPYYENQNILALENLRKEMRGGGG